MDYLSAIDVGSNAMRMLVVAHDQGQIKVIKKIRAAVRLGADSFSAGLISDKTLKKAIEAFQGFAEMNTKFRVHKTRAVATSALREAKNKDAFIHRIYEQTGLFIELIDGIEEAELIHKAISHEVDLLHSRTMSVDIGGGSVEITFANKGRILATRSFPMGTVRSLQTLKSRQWSETELPVLMGEYVTSILSYLEENTQGLHIDFCIGTGGNLECIGELKTILLRKTNQSIVMFKELSEMMERLKAISMKQRVDFLGLRPDRADVILIACHLIAALMRHSEVSKLVIPQVGLRDGLIWSMLEKSSAKANLLTLPHRAVNSPGIPLLKK